MKVLIVGLGLMGGAYAYRLMDKGYQVYGVDINSNAVKYAKDNKFIIDGSNNPSDFISDMDIIVLAIYPQAIIKFLNEYNSLFKENQIITDICGVKTSFVKDAYNNAKPAIYCSHHPMAGREKIGIEYSKECVFSGANYLITPSYDVPSNVIDTLYKMGVDLGFKRVTVMDIEKHDKMVGFTSQLTHAIAVSLVNSDHDDDTKNYIGDSYRDLTRIAMINEDLWSELFLENKNYLVDHIDSFLIELNKLKSTLAKQDKEALKEIFRSSTRIRKEMEK
ncbi:MAG: prephenate dehydrogenase [Acholeplasmatales bacterium]|nr:prephenate dehydrogenase [Acholeplasmatales bacterium]